MASLAEAVAGPPPDGGLWTGPKVAAWIGRETGRAHVHPQRGWAYLRRLDQSWQTPRPHHEQAATPEEQEAFKKPLKSAASAYGFSLPPYSRYNRHWRDAND